MFNGVVRSRNFIARIQSEETHVKEYWETLVDSNLRMSPVSKEHEPLSGSGLRDELAQ